MLLPLVDARLSEGRDALFLTVVPTWRDFFPEIAIDCCESLVLLLRCLKLDHWTGPQF